MNTEIKRTKARISMMALGCHSSAKDRVSS